MMDFAFKMMPSSSAAFARYGFIDELCLAWFGLANQSAPRSCSTNDEFCIKNDEFCIQNDEFCIKNDEFCIKNDEQNLHVVLSMDPTNTDFLKVFEMNLYEFI